jgi:hypothetical protein
METPRTVWPRPQLPVGVANVGAGNDDKLHPERTEFRD